MFLPRFSGDSNPESWILRAELYFTYLGFDEKDWLPLPSFYLDGTALTWFDWLFRNKQFYDWNHFKVKLLLRFRQRSFASSVEGLACFDSFSVTPSVLPATMDSDLNNAKPEEVAESEISSDLDNGNSSPDAPQLFDNFSHRAEKILPVSSLTDDDLEIIAPVLNKNFDSGTEFCGNPNLIIGDYELPLVLNDGEGNIPTYRGEEDSHTYVKQVFNSYSQRVAHTLAEHEVIESLCKRSDLLLLDRIRLNHMNLYIQLPFDPGVHVEAEECTRNKVIASNFPEPELVGSNTGLTASLFTTVVLVASVMPSATLARLEYYDKWGVIGIASEQLDEISSRYVLLRSVPLESSAAHSTMNTIISSILEGAKQATRVYDPGIEGTKPSLTMTEEAKVKLMCRYILTVGVVSFICSYKSLSEIRIRNASGCTNMASNLLIPWLSHMSTSAKIEERFHVRERNFNYQATQQLKTDASKDRFEINRLQGTSLAMSTAYHPQTDGQSEALNKCVEQYLRCFVADVPTDWVAMLPWAEYWYNTSYQSSSGMTPFQALYGREPPTVARYILGSSSSDLGETYLVQRDEVLILLKQNLSKAQVRMKKLADTKRTEITFSVGDWVYVKLKPYRQTSIREMPSHKLDRRFFGPFQIIKRVGEVAYKLELPETAWIHSVFHVSLLRRCVGTPTHQITPLNLATRAPSISNLEDKVLIDK